MSLLLLLSSGQAFPLTCEGSSLLLDGKPANLNVGRVLLAETQTYNEDLNPANLNVGRVLLAETQTYNEDLNPANLNRGRVLLAEAQTYNEDLKPANLNRGRVIIADTKSYSIAIPAQYFISIASSTDITINPPAGWGLHTITDLSQASSPNCIYYGLSPSIGDQILYRTTTETNAWTVTVSSTGIVSTSSSGADTIKFRRWTPSVWSAELTYTLISARILTADTQTYTEDLKPANLAYGRKQVSGGSVYRTKTEVDGPALFTDTITQANGTILGDTTEWDRWDTDNLITIVSDGTNALISQQNRDSVGVVVASVSFGPDQWSEQVHQTGTNNRLGAGPIVRGTSGPLTNGYVFRPEVVPTTTFNIYKYVNGGGSIIASSGPEIVSTLSSGTYTSRLEIVGNRLYGYLNGKLVVTAVDSSITTGQPGFQIYYSGATTSFSAGQIEASTTGLNASRTLSCDSATYSEDLQPTNLILQRKITTNTGYLRLLTAARQTNFSDNFNRADESLDASANWQRADTEVGSLSITTNKVTGTDIGNVYSGALADDQWAEFTFYGIAPSGTSKGAAVLLRATGGTSSFTGYTISLERSNTEPGTDLVRIRYCSNVATFTNAFSLGTSLAFYRVPDFANNTAGAVVLRAEVVGSTITAYINGNPCLFVSDSQSTSGKVGIWTDSANIDDFNSGSFTDTLFLKANRTLSCDPATYAEDLQPANLIVGRKLIAKVYADEQLFSDDFTGAAAVLGSNYTQQGDALLRLDGLGNVYNATSSARAIAWPNSVTFATDQYAEITLTQIASANSGNSGILLRTQTTEPIGIEKGYTFKTGDNGQAYTLKEYNESSTDILLASTTIIPKVGDRLRAVVFNNALYFYVNNQLIASASDTSWTTGIPAIYGFSNGWKSDNFVAGNYGGLHLAGTYTNTLAARTLSCDPATYTLELKDATLTKVSAKVLTADSQTYNEDLQPANLVVGKRLVSDIQTYTEDLKPANLVVGKRLVVEEFRANYLRNSMMVDTVAGTPGTAPTFWSITQAAWATRTIIGTGIDATTGLTYIDISYTGTNNTGAISSLIVDPITATTQSASVGQTWTSSSYFGLVAGTWPTNANIITVARNASSAGVGNSSVSIKSISSSALQRFTSTHTISNSTAVYIQTAIRFDVSNGETANFTVRIAAPQLERGAVATTFIPTTNAVVYRWFELTGQTANLLRNRNLVADQQTYNEILRDANLLRGIRVAADQQTYNEILRDASLLIGRRVAADQQTYNEILRDANLLRGRRVVADQQTYNEILRDANLLRGIRVAADQQTYALDLKAATITKTAVRTLTATATSFAVAPTVTGLIYARRFTLEKATFTIAPTPVNLLVGKKLTATVQTYTIGSTEVTFLRGLRVGVTAQAFTLTGPPTTNIFCGRKLTLTTSTYSYLPSQTNVFRGRILTLTTSTYSYLPSQTNVLRNRKVIADTRLYSLSHSSTNLIVARKLTLTVYNTNLTRNPANLLIARRVGLNTTTLNISQFDTKLLCGRRLALLSSSYALTLNIALLSRGGYIKVWTGSEWVSKPLRVWDGTAWVSKPLKVWTGSTWRTY